MAMTEEQKLALADAKVRAKEKAKEVEKIEKSKQRTATEGSLAGAGQYLDSAANAMTVGAVDLAERYIGAGADYGLSRLGLTDDPRDSELSYGDFVNRIQQEQQQGREDFPMMDMLGTMSGAVGTGVGTAKAASEALQTTTGPAQSLLSNVVGRTTGGAALGAGEAVSLKAGQGELTPENLGPLAAAGAAFGGLGQAAGELAAPAGRWLSGRFKPEGAERLANEKMAGSLMDDAVGEGSLAARVNDGKGLTIDQLNQMISETGGEAGRAFGETGGVIGEQAQKNLMEEYIASSRDPATAGMTAPTAELGARRVAEKQASARGVLEENLSGNSPVTPPAAAKEQFQQIFDSDLGRTYPVAQKDSLIDGLSNMVDRAGNPILDTTNRKGPSERLVARLKKELDDVTDSGHLTMKGLQNVKSSLDKSIKSAWKDDMTSKDAMDVKDLVSLKNHIKGAMEEGDDAYRQASAMYADEMATKDAAEMGAKLLRGTNNTMPVSTVDDYMGSLSPVERVYAQQGAVDWLMGQLDQNPNFLKKIAENKSTQDRLQAVFGDRIANNATSLDEIVDSVSRDMEQMKQYQQLADSQSAHKGASSGRVSGAQGRSKADIGIIGAQAGKGTPMSGISMSAARRLGTGQPNAIAQQVAEKQQALLQADSPYRAFSIIDDALRSRNQPNAGMTGAGIGAGLGVSGTQGASTLLDY